MQQLTRELTWPGCLSNNVAGTQEGGVAQQQRMTKTMQQLLQSSKHLIKLKYDTQQAVTAVRVQSDEQESMRRQKDERMRQVRADTGSQSKQRKAEHSAVRCS